VTVTSVQTNPRWAVPTLTFGGLGHHSAVDAGRVEVRERLLDAEAGEFLIGDGSHDDLTVDAGEGSVSAGDEGGGEPGLHIAGAAGVQPVILDAGRESFGAAGRPTVSRWPHSSNRRPPRSRPPRKMTLGRPVVPSITSTLRPTLRPHRAM
jgi:hypothetical protein